MSDKNVDGRPASAASNVDEDMVKADVQHTEAGDAVPTPESIRNMTDEEIQKLRKKMVRKMDMVIMPIMGILYLLNCEFLSVHFHYETCLLRLFQLSIGLHWLPRSFTASWTI